MAQTSLADLSLSDALESLAFRKQALDAGEVERIPADLLTQTDVFRAIGSRIAEKQASAQKRAFQPDMQQTLAMTGGGALLGGIGGLATARPGRRSWRNAMEGAVAGAALGGGASLVDQAAGTNLGRQAATALGAAPPAQVSTPAPGSGASISQLDPATAQRLADIYAKKDTGWLSGILPHLGITGGMAAGNALRTQRYDPAVDLAALRDKVRTEALLPLRQQLAAGKNLTKDVNLASQISQFRDTVGSMAAKHTSGIADRLRPDWLKSNWLEGGHPMGQSTANSADWLKSIFTGDKADVSVLGKGLTKPREELNAAINSVRNGADVKKLLQHTPAAPALDDIVDATKASWRSRAGLARMGRGGLVGGAASIVPNAILGGWNQRLRSRNESWANEQLAANPALKQQIEAYLNSK